LACLRSVICINLQCGNSKKKDFLNTDIKHRAFVKEVGAESLKVTILNESACSGCHAKGACSMSDFQEKEIEITHFTESYSPGQEVTVIFQESQGFRALFYGYLFPFIAVMLTLIITSSLTNNEVTSGLLSLGILVPYYSILYFFRDNFKKVFKFEVEKRG